MGLWVRAPYDLVGPGLPRIIPADVGAGCAKSRDDDGVQYKCQNAGNTSGSGRVNRCDLHGRITGFRRLVTGTRRHGYRIEARIGESASH